MNKHLCWFLAVAAASSARAGDSVPEPRFDRIDCARPEM
jgi:hypothetical protein